MPFGIFGLDNKRATGLMSKGAVGFVTGCQAVFPARAPAGDGPADGPVDGPAQSRRRHGDAVRTSGGSPMAGPTEKDAVS
ncbi:hypothetical protein SCMC78_54080 [Streptomyces sp. CMC78]|uniref:Uncharacterized protein n=1 Tax=Streptomyces sp. CMC78 TaxID=3231512 RepID=A0AB33KNJ4_9ACTN